MKKAVVVLVVIGLISSIGIAALTSHETPRDFSLSKGTLTWKGHKYVTGDNEINLQPLAVTDKVADLKNDYKLYRISGQETKDWLAVRGPMLPDKIFRNQKLPPVNFEKLEVSEIQLVLTRGTNLPVEYTRDKGVIEDIRASVSKGTWQKFTGPAYKFYMLRLVSPELRGLGYTLYAVIDQENKVYLAKTKSLAKGVRAGTEVSRWILGWVKK